MGFYYFVNGQALSRAQFCEYMSQWGILVQRVEEEAMSYFAATGNTIYDMPNFCASIVRAW